ncbi:MAG: hypothetical protein CML68_18965 [Rhodobacteraceae bacterium]|nr:hypothetical protein [Paracoccaceae bacterium]
MAAKPDINAEKKAAKAALSESRSKPISFAALISKDGVVFQADKKKPVDAMVRAAKALGGSGRGAWGTMSSSGSTIVLECDDTPASKIDTLLKKYFADRGQTVKVEIRTGAQDTGPTRKPPEAADDIAEPTRTEPDASQPDPDTPDDKNGQMDTEAPSRMQAPPAPDTDDLGAPDPDTDDPDPPEDPDDPDDALDQAAQAGDLKSLLLAARKKPYNFALMLGREDLVFTGHRRRTPTKLVKEAKAAGGSSRGAWGSMQVDAKTVVLTCEEAPPAALAKKARRFLKARDLQFKVICRLRTGEIVDSDEDDDILDPPLVAETVPSDTPADAPQPTPADPTDQTDDQADREALNRQLVSAKQILALFADAPRTRKKLDAALGKARRSARDKDMPAARASLKELAQIARDAPRTPAEKWTRVVGDLKGMTETIKDTARTHKETRGYLTELCSTCVSAASTGDFATADRRLDQVEQAVRAARTPPLNADQLEQAVTALAPRTDTVKTDYTRIHAALKPALAQDHPDNPAVTRSLDAFREAATRRDTPALLGAIGELRRQEATIEDAGSPMGQDGVMTQQLAPEAAARLHAFLQQEGSA